MSDAALARRQIAKYRQAQAEDRVALDLIDAGWRHFDQEAGQRGLTDSTGRYRERPLAHTEMLDELIRLYQRDITG